jgi:hypothetical protein
MTTTKAESVEAEPRECHKSIIFTNRLKKAAGYQGKITRKTMRKIQDASRFAMLLESYQQNTIRISVRTSKSQNIHGIFTFTESERTNNHHLEERCTENAKQRS